MKFLCDEMLKGLARWLRAAGYDAELATDGEGDRALLERARREGRLLLTRDRKLLEFRDAGRDVLLLECNGLAECAHELVARLGLDWQHRPFTRCLVCNVPVEPAGPEDADRVPADVREGPLYRCPRCGRLYWEGSHVRRMRTRLADWKTR
ncbi:Mut7-C RNAse domain-containing protein [Thiohalobacter sp. IOR34]|uniref:Mut7-C RNAse domain-containing protein n=1 Tax=Thiohalobacter sp. IOR34 TaxID=3057176 RepID=UPI0025AEFFC4|nr:Mut7-C RNAse domain-containing protein [Thiohalobacter sp. IOR34]WJW76215.1 Mut7-C RNAse domain-containing protein [Thiohalobacter sp. IOR34]